MPVVGASRAIFDPAMESTVTLGNLVPGMRDLWLAIWLSVWRMCSLGEVCLNGLFIERTSPMGGQWLCVFQIFKSQKYSFRLRSNQILHGFPLKLSFQDPKIFFSATFQSDLGPLSWLSMKNTVLVLYVKSLKSIYHHVMMIYHHHHIIICLYLALRRLRGRHVRARRRVRQVSCECLDACAKRLGTRLRVQRAAWRRFDRTRAGICASTAPACIACEPGDYKPAPSTSGSFELCQACAEGFYQPVTASLPGNNSGT